MKKSFYEWCIEEDHLDLLKMWDNSVNECDPKDVSYRADKRITFSCGNSKHPAKHLKIASVTDPNRTGLTQERFCIGCHSVGKYFEDYFGEDYLLAIWSDKNVVSPYEIPANSKAKRIWLRCLNDSNHPDYDLTAGNIVNTFGCPYCRNRRLFDGNNLAVQHPEVYKYWSDKNIKDPSEYISTSHEKAWFKCHLGKHRDYKREIRHEIRLNYKCPICLRIDCALKGIDHPYYNGNQSEDHQQRTNSDYRNWRSLVYERDKYTCQCCGKIGVKLNSHHIYSFASYPKLRFDINNGITLCEECHSFVIDGGFHNLYGNRDATPQQLEEYINTKRRTLGIKDIFSIDDYIGSTDPSIINKSA